MANQPYSLAPESADVVGPTTPALIPAFDPIELRARADGWTADRQREFVEALADCGVVREAAGRVGMSEQSVARLRRRAGSASFVAACESALTIATRRLRSVAFDRAVNGYTKRHYYHGELKSEERVYDHRLLTYLLGKTGLIADPGGRVAKSEVGWSKLIDAVDKRAATIAGPDGDDPVWEVGGRLWTRFPPPTGFRGTEDGAYGDGDYRRTLTKAETAALEARDARQHDAERESEARRRDSFFGFAQHPYEP